MSIKNVLLAAAIGLTLAPAAFAADQTSLQVHVKAEIPKADGLIVSATNGWNNFPQTLPYDPVAETLVPITQTISIKSPSKVSAFLSDAPHLNNGTTLLPMQVRVGGVPLAAGQANKVEVASAIEATTNILKPVQLAAAKPAAGYEEGSYLGSVTMVFENE